jgi:hypothetical protein
MEVLVLRGGFQQFARLHRGSSDGLIVPSSEKDATWWEESEEEGAK